ncbi:hypothetical protein V565_222870, partial [Rhizoctonia solani 123E]
MPSATRSGSISSAQAKDTTPSSEINATKTNGYNTRGKSYKYSHTKAPFIPPPAQPTKRRAPPISVARKRQRDDVDATAEERNTNPSTDAIEESETQAIDNTIKSSSMNATENLVPNMLGGSDLHDDDPLVDNLLAPHQTFASSDSHDPAPSDTPNSDIEASESNLRETSPRALRRISITQSTKKSVYTGTTPSTTWPISNSAPNLPFTTPRCPAQPIQFTPSTVVIFQTPPTWARFSTQEERDFSLFLSGSSTLFTRPSARIENVNSDNPLPERPVPNSDHTNSASHQGQLVNAIASASRTENIDVFSGTHTNYPNPDSQSNTSSSIPMGICTNSAPHTQPTALVVRTPTSEFAFNPPELKLEPSNGSHATYRNEPCFYAEEDLEVLRNDCNIGQSALEFVRKKESSIRCELQAGILSIIEESYGVNNTTIEKLNKLISQLNYVYTEYNIETKKVSGRYHHPCLIRILVAILFTKRKRGRPIGVRFMPLIMEAHHSMDEARLPEAAGITTSMIALACTLVLCGLQSIKAGDSSERLGTRREKPVPFTKKRYSAHYRNFANKIKQYNRVEEVRKAYLEEI